MPFDPNEYLKEESSVEFDPNAYLADEPVKKKASSEATSGVPTLLKPPTKESTLQSEQGGLDFSQTPSEILAKETPKEVKDTQKKTLKSFAFDINEAKRKAVEDPLKPIPLSKEEAFKQVNLLEKRQLAVNSLAKGQEQLAKKTSNELTSLQQVISKGQEDINKLSSEGRKQEAEALWNSLQPTIYQFKEKEKELNSRLTKLNYYDKRAKATDQEMINISEGQQSINNQWDRLNAGLNTLSANFLRSPQFAYNTLIAAQNKIAREIGLPEAPYQEEGYLSNMAKYFEQNADAYHKVVEKKQKQADYDIISLFKKGENAKALNLLLENIVESAPTTGAIAMGGVAGLTNLGTTIGGGLVFGAGTFEENKKKGIDDATNVVNSWTNGLLEGIFESTGTLSIINDAKNIFVKSGKEAVEESAKNIWQKVYGKAAEKLFPVTSAVKEGISEGETTFTQNIINIVQGVDEEYNKKYQEIVNSDLDEESKNQALSELTKEAMFKGVPDAFLTGVGMGAILGGGAKKGYVAVDDKNRKAVEEAKKKFNEYATTLTNPTVSAEAKELIQQKAKEEADKIVAIQEQDDNDLKQKLTKEDYEVVVEIQSKISNLEKSIDNIDNEQSKAVVYEQVNELNKEKAEILKREIKQENEIRSTDNNIPQQVESPSQEIKLTPIEVIAGKEQGDGGVAKVVQGDGQGELALKTKEEALDTRNAKEIGDIQINDINLGNVVIGYHATPTGEIGTGKELGIHIGTEDVSNNIKKGRNADKGDVKKVAFRVNKPLILGDMPSWSSVNVLNEMMRLKLLGIDKEKIREIRDSDLSEKEKQQRAIELAKENGYDSFAYQNFDEGNGEFSYVLFDDSKLNDITPKEAKATPQAGSVVGGEKIKLDPDLAKIDPTLIAARNGDVEAQKQFEEMGLDWKQTTTYRFVGQSEVDVLLSNEKVESKRGMADAGIDVTSSPKVTTAATGEYRVTFKESFDKNNGLGKVRKKNEEDSNLERGRGYDINDVAKIERIDEKGNVVETIYDQSQVKASDTTTSKKSILNSDTDLKGDEKDEFMLPVTYTQSKRVGDEVQFVNSQGEQMTGNYRGTNTEGKAIIDRPQSKDGKKYNLTAVVPESDVIFPKYEDTGLDKGSSDAIKYAIENDLYTNAISEGRMTATDAVKIIESAGLEVPKDIAEQSLKETPQEGSVVGASLRDVELKMRRPEKNEVIFVSVDALLQKHAADQPSYDVQKEGNRIKGRVEKAKEFIKNYIKDQRAINPKTGERMNTKVSFEPSVVDIDANGKISFEDGRHRVLAAKEMGLTEVPIEVPKERVKAVEQSLKETPQEVKVSTPEKVQEEAKALTKEEIQAEEEQDEMLLSGESDKRRRQGKFTKDGITYVRQKETEGVEGSQDEVVFAKGVTKKFKYKVIDRSQLQPSHLGGLRNSMHFIPEAQPKRRTDSGSIAAEQTIANNPNLKIAGENTNAYSGAPVVNKRGEVIQGNNRAAGLVKAYKQGTASNYKQDLINNAEKYGMTKEQVEAMEEPVLVRELDVNDTESIELGNYEFNDIETGNVGTINPVKIVSRMTKKIKEALVREAFKGEYGTTNESIRGNFDAIEELLVRYLNVSQYQALRDSNKNPSTKGIEAVNTLLQRLVFDGGDVALSDMFEGLPPSKQNTILKAAVSIISLPTDITLLQEFQNAIVGFSNFVSRGTKSVDAWSKEYDAFTNSSPRDIYTPLELEMIRLLSEKPQSEFSKMFKDYSVLVKGKKAEGMWGEDVAPITKAEAVENIFKIKQDEQQSKESGTGSSKKVSGEKAEQEQPQTPTEKAIDVYKRLSENNDTSTRKEYKALPESIKRVLDNIVNIHQQLEQKKIITKKGNCP